MTVVNCANDDIGDGHHARVKIQQNKEKKIKEKEKQNKTKPVTKISTH